MQGNTLLPRQELNSIEALVYTPTRDTKAPSRGLGRPTSTPDFSTPNHPDPTFYSPDLSKFEGRAINLLTTSRAERKHTSTLNQIGTLIAHVTHEPDASEGSSLGDIDAGLLIYRRPYAPRGKSSPQSWQIRSPTILSQVRAEDDFRIASGSTPGQ